jgi:competence protein ComEA
MRAPRNHCALGFSSKLLAILLLLWLTAASLAPAAQHKESKEQTKAPPTSIEINHASAEDFERLPGIGPELARRIVAYRKKHGPFRRVEDVLVIRGIGPKKWKALRPHLRVDEKSAV